MEGACFPSVHHDESRGHSYSCSIAFFRPQRACPAGWLDYDYPLLFWLVVMLRVTVLVKLVHPSHVCPQLPLAHGHQDL